MSFKTIITIILLSTSLFSAYEKVSIGSIDSYYENKISRYELRQMLEEIEYVFESSMGVNAFDYSSNGKPINFIYVPPSSLEHKIQRKQNKQKEIRKKLDSLKKTLPNKRKEVLLLKSIFEKKNQIHNKKVSSFNKYIKNINKQKNLTKNDILKIKEDVKKQNQKFNQDIKNLKDEQRNLKKLINSYNNKTHLYNKNITKFNNLSKDIESMSRSLKKIRGKTFALKEIQIRTIFKDGKIRKEKKIKTKMDKIEIYGFTSKAELKAILAHEIGHLIGLPHINSKNALMNPLLQESQIKNLSLSFEDRQNFRDNF